MSEEKMPIRRVASVLLASAIGGTLMAAVAAAESWEPGTVSACVTGDDAIMKAAFGDDPARPCSAGETEVHWAVERAPARPVASTDLVPGATLLTSEIEPGVMRVLEDGSRGLRGVHDVVIGLDGSVWTFWNDRFMKLGDPTTYAWSNDLFDIGQDSSEDIEVGPDGTLWWADPDGDGLQSFAGGEWTLRRAAPRDGRVDQVEVLGDGTVIASWWLGGPGEGRRKVARLDGDAWTVLASVPGSRDARLGVSEEGEVTLYLGDVSGTQHLYRGSLGSEGDASLARVDMPRGQAIYVDTGSDGTTWVHLARDPDGCGPGECMVRESQLLARLDETGWTEFPLAEGLGGIGGLMTAPDGSVWSATCDFLDESWTIPGCELLRFDGETWSRFLGRLGYGDIDEIAFDADGDTWSISGPNELFVVRSGVVTRDDE